MVERKLFKTKLCILYQKGHCPRQSCSFAHGDAELRRFSGSFNGRRDYPASDLREKLDRRHSPRRRGTKGRHALHGESPSLSPEKRSERRNRKKQYLDGQSDVSGSLKISGGSDGVKERKVASSSAKNILEEQLKQVQLDIEMLDDRKSQLEVCLEEKVQEANSLISRNEELEAQLSKERDDCKRIVSKIKKFIRAHGRYSRAQEEVKRSRARLQRLEDEFVSDASRPNFNEDDSSVNIVSDEDPDADNGTSPRFFSQSHTSPSVKRPRTSLGATEEAKPGNTRKSVVGGIIEKVPQVDAAAAMQSESICKEGDGVGKIVSRGNGHSSRPLANEHSSKRRKNDILSNTWVEKVKGVESAPPTSMAAHAVDELIDVIEMENTEVIDGVSKKRATREKKSLAYLPPPPPRNAYKQYEAEDENVDVEDVDLEV